jgi:hypothetical protein
MSARGAELGSQAPDRALLRRCVEASPESGGLVKDDDIKAFFKRYESCFNQALTGDVDLDQVASLYASDFIAASPAGVMTGKNGDQLKQVMAQAYASDVAMDFEVHYFVQVSEGKPQVFGWVSGDEQALLKEHGIIDDSQRHT